MAPRSKAPGLGGRFYLGGGLGLRGGPLMRFIKQKKEIYTIEGVKGELHWESKLGLDLRFDVVMKKAHETCEVLYLYSSRD